MLAEYVDVVSLCCNELIHQFRLSEKLANIGSSCGKIPQRMILNGRRKMLY
jgi:hypothetical protein